MTFHPPCRKSSKIKFDFESQLENGENLISISLIGAKLLKSKKCVIFLAHPVYPFVHLVSGEITHKLKMHVIFSIRGGLMKWEDPKQPQNTAKRTSPEFCSPSRKTLPLYKIKTPISSYFLIRYNR